MSEPARFLGAFGQALSAMTLYPSGHPSRERAVDLAFDELDALSATELPRFSFVDDEVVYGRLPLRDMRGWDWGARLSQAGVGRVELVRQVTRDEFDEFLTEVQARVTNTPLPTSAQRQMRDLGIRFGALELDVNSAIATPRLGDAAAGGAPGAREEVETLRWMHGELLEGRAIPLVEAEAVVRSLSIAIHAEAGMLLPLLQLKEFDQYTTTHSLNVSVLAMALAEVMTLTPREVRAMGVSGLLHDVGKTAIPLSLLTKSGALTAEERLVMNRHPGDGARIILRGDGDLELAAVVAYEHHVMLDGGGYPPMHYARGCAFASRLVHVCDVYDALSTKRPYRDAWPQDRTLAYLEERAGAEFDPFLVQAFTQMMRAGAARVRRLDADGSPIV